MYSEYPGISGKPLPGDLVVEFSNANRASEFSIWLIVLVAVLLVAVLSLIVAFNVKRRRISV
jgi:hypothetical protein